MCEQLYSIYLKDGEKLFPQSNEFKFESNVLIISGGHEIVTPDIYQWMLNQNILKVKHIIYKDMCHCFPIVPIKQANEAIKKIRDFLMN